MNILVRAAADEDAALLAEMTRAAWSGRVAPTSSGHRETMAAVAEHLKYGGGFLLVVDDSPAGSVRWLPHQDEAGVWEMLRMGVLPAFGGRQLSQHLLESVIHLAQASDVRELRLAVRADQEKLVALYAAYGFETAPELEYSHANPMEAPPIVMRRHLKH